MKTLFALFALAAPAFAENVLVYRDIPIAPERMQSAFAGHTVTFARSPGEFGSRLAAGGYGLAVFLNQARASSESSAAITALGVYAADGGRVIYSDWSQNSALAAPFGAGFAGDTDGGDVTVDPTLATGIAGGVVKVRTTTWFSSAAILSAPVGSVVAATYPGGQPAIVTGNSGRTAVLGFLSDTPTSSQLFTNLVSQTLAAPLDPVIAGNSAVPTSTASADLSASVDTNRLACTVFFDYGPDDNYGTSLSVSIPAGSADPVAIAASASGLAPHTLYHWRARVVGGTNVVTGPDATFTTLNTAPVAGTSTVTLGTGNSIEVVLPFTTPDADGDMVSVTSIGSGTLFSTGAGSTPGRALITAGTMAVGTQAFTFEVSDGIDSAIGTVNVTIVDDDAPSLTLNGAALHIVEAGTPYTEPGASASDLVAGDLTSAITISGAVNTLLLGDYPVSYSVSDGVNTTTAVRTVRVVDTTPPLIALNGAATITIEAPDPFSDPGATASDTRAGNLTSAIVVTGSVNTSVLGSYTLTYTVSDGILSASTSRTVLVRDTTAPAITATPAAARQYVINSALATLPDFRGEIIAQDASAISVVQSPVPGTQLGVGIHIITYAVTDAVGLISNGSSTYEVLAIALSAGATTPTTAGFSATLDTKGLATSFTFDYGTDTNYGSSVVATIPAGSLAPVTVPANVAGLAPHTVYHWRSRIVVGTAVVTSVDATFNTLNTPPVAGTSTVTLGTGNSIEVLLPLTNPDVDGDVVSVTSIGTGTLFATAAGSSAGRVRISAGSTAVGTQAFTFVISDGIASATGTVTVTVVDDDLPSLTLNGAALITVEAGSPYNEPGAIASDLVGGDLTSAIVISGAVNTGVVGNYPVTYSVSDGPNTATVVRTVSVVDTILPVITLNGPATMSVEIGSAFLDPGAVASDARAGNLTSSITVSGTVNTAIRGAYVLTYSVSDGILTASATRTVNVVDTTPPVITSTPAPRSHYVSGTNKATLPDLRGGLVAVDATAVTVTQSPAAGTLLAAGEYTVTFTATDAGGGSSTATTLYRVISFATVGGQYAGIAVRSGADEGLVNFLLSKTGFASGRVHLNGVNWTFSGTLNSAGYVALNLTSPSALAMTLQLQPNGTCAFTAASTGGAWSAVLGRSPFTSTSPSPWTGSHRILCIPASPSAASPQGAGYFTATVTAEGKITLTGRFADGTSVSGNSAVFADHTFPVFMSGQTGGTAIAKLSGMMAFASTPGSDSTGSLTWTKPAGARPVDAYTSFTQSIAASGSFYRRPARGPSITLGTAGNATLTVSSTMLGTVAAGTIGFSGSTPIWTNPPFTFFSLSVSTGEMTGFVKIDNVVYSFRGTTHQKQNIIAGYATSPSGSHYVTLVPNP